MIDDVAGEAVDQKNPKVVPEVVIAISENQYLDLGHDHSLDQEVVVVHDLMIDIADIDVAGNTKLLNLLFTCCIFTKKMLDY